MALCTYIYRKLIKATPEKCVNLLRIIHTHLHLSILKQTNDIQSFIRLTHILYV